MFSVTSLKAYRILTWLNAPAENASGVESDATWCLHLDRSLARMWTSSWIFAMTKKAPVVSFHLVGGRPLGRFPPCSTGSKSKIVCAGVSGGKQRRCPYQRSVRWASWTEKGVWPVNARRFLLLTKSCQRSPSVRRRCFVWAIFTVLSTDQVSAP